MVEDGSRSAQDAEAISEVDLEAEWEAVDSDPDLSADLGYDLETLDVLVTSNKDKKVMVLPRAEEWVEEDAYMIADHELACDPVERA